MDSSEQKFFEELAKFGAKKAKASQSSDELEDDEITPTVATETAADEIIEDEPEVQLAKATYKPTMKKVEKDDEIIPEGSLTIDVYQTPNDIVVESAIAGVGPEDIDIEVSNDSVTIRGERQKQHEAVDNDYFYQECYWGRFSRSVILPQEVDPETASVTFKNGILTVRLPKMNRKKSRKLKVRMD